MKLKTFSILFIAIFFSCKGTKIENNDGKLITHSLCKNSKIANSDNEKTCVEYSFNNKNSTLNLKHINTVFNCCPKKLYCDISVKNDTIFIEETERENACDCLCLYDMEIEVYDIKTQKYTIKYKEQYIGTYDELIFKIDLNKKISGSFCFERTEYPYGI